MSYWIQALKIYNEGTGAWCMPRKGTPQHAEVMKIKLKLENEKSQSVKMEQQQVQPPKPRRPVLKIVKRIERQPEESIIDKTVNAYRREFQKIIDEAAVHYSKKTMEKKMKYAGYGTEPQEKYYISRFRDLTLEQRVEKMKEYLIDALIGNFQLYNNIYSYDYFFNQKETTQRIANRLHSYFMFVRNMRDAKPENYYSFNRLPALMYDAAVKLYPKLKPLIKQFNKFYNETGFSTISQN